MEAPKTSDRTLWRARKGVILPPEASASWVLDHAFLWQALQGDCIVIDIADVERYRRLASKSYIDFLIAYLFTLLINRRILCPIDYRQLLPVDMRRHIATCSKAIAQRNERDGAHLFDLGRRGYQQYIGYARSDSKEVLYRNSGNPDDLEGFQRSKQAAINQLNMIEHETYDKSLLVQYAKRLTTKCLVAHYISERLFQHYGIRLRVFDSPEYAVGADMLRSHHTIPQVHRDQDFFFADLGVAAEIRDRETTFAGGEYGDSMIYTAVAAALRPDLYASLMNQIQSGHSVKPDIRRSIHATHMAALEGVGKRSLYKTLLGSFLSLFSGFVVWPAFLSIAQLISGLIEYRVARSSCKDLMTEMNPIDEFVLLSAHVERSLPEKRNIPWWGNWLQHIFHQPVREDFRWQLSQKTMGTWLETGIYVPWFENLETSESKNPPNKK